MTIHPKIIAIDFDDTCVKQPINCKYPDVGPTNPGSVEVLKELVEAQHRLILWTVRDLNKSGLLLAIQWFEQNEIPLFGVNFRPHEDSDPDPKGIRHGNIRHSNSPKARANLYIDDAALGCPLIKEGHPNFHHDWRPHADWKRIREILVEKNYLV